MLTLVTVCDADNAPEALVLAESFLAHHPDGRVLAVVADAASPPAFGGHERVEVRTGRELVGPRYELLAAGLSDVGLAQALLPAALEAAPLPAIAIAPGAEVLAPISLGASDGVLVTATGAAEAGVVDDGMVAVTGPGAGEVLTWWNASAASYDVEELVAEAATRFAQVTVVRDPRWAVAAWNAEDRGVTSAADGRLVLPDGSPVTWARLGGHGVAAGPLAAAARDHVQRVAAAEFALGPMTLESLLLPGGTPLDDRLQRLFVDGVRDGALTRAPFDAAGFAAFQRWLDEPDPFRRPVGFRATCFVSGTTGQTCVAPTPSFGTPSSARDSPAGSMPTRGARSRTGCSRSRSPISQLPGRRLRPSRSTSPDIYNPSSASARLRGA